MRSPAVLMVIAVMIFFAGIVASGPLLNKVIHQERKPVRGYLDMIDLSAEQKRRVEEIRKGFLPKVEHIRQELRGKRLELNDLIFASQPDMKVIDDKTMEIADLQAKLEKEVINHIIQEKEILTFDQQRQFHEIIRKEFEKGGLGIHGEQGRENNGRREGE
jgi:Spy/CpxP family protein refolding chaperone